MADITAEKTVVYVSVEGGIAETEYYGPDVTIVHIDWDNVTPDSYIDPSEVLDPMELAFEQSRDHLPERVAIQNVLDMREWLRDNLLDFPENDGYEAARELEKSMTKFLSDHGAHP